MASEHKGLIIGLGEAGNKVRVRYFVGNTAWGCLTSAALPPTYTLTQMPKNLTLVVATQEAWRFAGSNNNKRLALNGLIDTNLFIIQYMPPISVCCEPATESVFVHMYIVLLSKWAEEHYSLWESLLFFHVFWTRIGSLSLEQHLKNVVEKLSYEATNPIL